MYITLMDDIILYHQVFVDKICPIGIIGHNTANLCCRQKDEFRFFLRKEISHGLLIFKIQLLMCSGHKVLVTSCFEIFHDRRTHKPSVTGDVYF